METKNNAAQQAYDLMQQIPRDEDGNPLTLEGVIRSVILKSPDWIQYRDDALGLIYCILGSGIHWIDGRLGDCNSNNYMNMPPKAGGQGCWSRNFGLDESLKNILEGDPETLRAMQVEIHEKHKRKLMKAVRTVEQIDVRCQNYRLNEVSWYPISWYACHLCAPANAQKDFFDGAIETATLICNARPIPGTQRWIVHQRTKAYAQEILSVLNQRKGKL